jgi:glyoxylase-like metal-dependent hydrolase (beta-lactamase superfamily II)
MTHLHLDHAGALNALEGPTVVVSSEEWRSANGGRGLARGYIKRQFDQAHDYRLIDYEQRSINSFASFGHSFDLFGDGSIVLVSTPGHSSGHQSVVLRLANREVLLVGDASYTRGNLDRGELPLVVPDEHKYKRSVREIRAYAQMTPGALVILGHDPEEFAELEELYA